MGGGWRNREWGVKGMKAGGGRRGYESWFLFLFRFLALFLFLAGVGVGVGGLFVLVLVDGCVEVELEADQP